MTTRRSISAVIAGGLMLPALHGVLTACGAPDATVVGSTTVSYRLSWDTSGATAIAQGWRFVTDRGFDVTLTRGFVITRRLQLVPCADQAAARDSGLARWLRPRLAYAGHGGDTLDPSAWDTPVLESLTALDALGAGTKTPGAQPYCQAHYLVAVASGAEAGAPADLAGDRFSVYLVGTYRRPGSATAATAFTVDTTLANGGFSALAPTAGAAIVDTRSSSARITFQRRLATLLDGLDLSSASDTDRAQQVLRNLIGGVTVVMEERPADARSDAQ